METTTRIFTCIKSKKKLLWNKGGLKPPPQISTPIPVTLTNLVTSASNISIDAWSSASTAVTNAVSRLPTINVQIGPQTLEGKLNISKGIASASNLWANFAQPTSVQALVFNWPDKSWAEIKYAVIPRTSSPFGDEVMNLCPSEIGCRNGAGWSEPDVNGIDLIGFAKPGGGWTYEEENSQTAAHEYTHGIQGTQFVGSAQVSNFNAYGMNFFTPCWYSEGQATFSELASMYKSNFRDYITNRKYYIGNLKGAKAQDFADVLSASTNFCDPGKAYLYYPMGMLAVEALAALGGVDSTMQVFKDLGAGMTFDQAFQKNWGSSWTDMQSIIFQSLAHEVSTL